MEKSEEFTTFSSDFICKIERYEKNIIICFKNETRLSQHVTWVNSYLPRFATLTREIFLIHITSAEIILSHFEGI